MKTRKKKGCSKDGNSFVKPLGNTKFENNQIDDVPSPREGSTPAPRDLNSFDEIMREGEY